MPEKQPVVSVLITTFNHESFIAQAIESALMQETPFQVEILVGDDASTDRTREIVEEFAETHPGPVHSILSEENAGGHHNFNRLYRAARGRYVALLEGDDYWTDPHKLRLQVEYLEARPEFALCYHPVRIVGPEGEEKGDNFTNAGDPPESGLERITRFNYVHTVSNVFRNGLIGGLPDWVFPLPLGDWPLCVLLAEHGKIGKLDRPMAAYRIHAGGSWGAKPELNRLIRTVRVAEVCRKHLGHPGFDDCIYKTARAAGRLARAQGKYWLAWRCLRRRLGVALRRPGLAWRARGG